MREIIAYDLQKFNEDLEDSPSRLCHDSQNHPQVSYTSGESPAVPVGLHLRDPLRPSYFKCYVDIKQV